MRKIITKELGALLLDSRLITSGQLQEALEIQKEWGGLLGQILVSLGHISEETIAQALTAQYGFPYLPLGGYEIDIEVAKIIPLHVAQQYGLVAVDRVGGILTVVMSNPLNAQAIEAVETITHYKVQIFVTTSTDIANMIREVYKK